MASFRIALLILHVIMLAVSENNQIQILMSILALSSSGQRSSSSMCVVLYTMDVVCELMTYSDLSANIAFLKI